VSLSDVKIRAAKPKGKKFKLFDGAGLYIEVSPTGGKFWRWKYRFGGKEKRLTLGVYPVVSLKAAREKRDTARQQLATGVDPSEARKASRPPRMERITSKPLPVNGTRVFRLVGSQAMATAYSGGWRETYSLGLGRDRSERSNRPNCYPCSVGSKTGEP
jgi:hypothetical protein